MFIERQYKIQSRKNNKINLKVIPGHFATTQSHINYYMDVSTLKARQIEAVEVAKTIAQDYQYDKPVDTIICIDGCDMIGAYLADELTKHGVSSKNIHHSLYVISPDFDSDGNISFSDNMRPMIDGKNVMVLLDTATTGKTVEKIIDCVIRDYGGYLQGISAIFSYADEIYGEPIHAIFTKDDIPSYQTFTPGNCPHCANRERLDAKINANGYVEY